MKSTIFIALVLQLLFKVTIEQPSGSKDTGTQVLQYGDIIGFQRGRCAFMHYGVYIDKLRFPDKGQKEGDNLFHITGIIKNGLKLSDCVFGKLTEEMRSQVRVHNYLDNIEKYKNRLQPRTEDDITARILNKLEHCRAWLPFQNNCEHLATYVRYGISISLQVDQKVEGWCHNPFNSHGFSKAEERDILNILRGTDNTAEDFHCVQITGEGVAAAGARAAAGAGARAGAGVDVGVQIGASAGEGAGAGAGARAGAGAGARAGAQSGARAGTGARKRWLG